MVPEVDRGSLPANLNPENAIPSLIFLLLYRRHWQTNGRPRLRVGRAAALKFKE